MGATNVSGNENKTTTTFQHHIDNAKEAISGGSINVIQNAINTVEVDAITAHGKLFKDECLFVLRNNPQINFLYMMEFDTLDDVMRVKSFRYKHMSESNLVTIDSQQGSNAIIHSVQYKTTFGQIMSHFILSADALIPVGATIKYYLSNDLNNYYPIKQGESTPTEMPWTDDKVYIKAELIANSKGQPPKLYNLALFCRDNQLTQQGTIVDPNLEPYIQEVDEVMVGDTLLQYDTVTGLLTAVTNPEGITTDVIYNSELELLRTEKLVGDQTIKKQLYRDTQGRVNKITTTIV